MSKLLVRMSPEWMFVVFFSSQLLLNKFSTFHEEKGKSVYDE